MLDAFEPTFSDELLRFTPYVNVGLSVSKVFLISEDENLIAFVSSNNVLDRSNVRDYTYNRDYTMKEADLYSQRTLYFGVVLNF